MAKTTTVREEHPTGTAPALALGLLETKGLVPFIVGVDAMLKAANVHLKTWRKADAALVLAVIEGDVASVRAAIDAGQHAASTIGTVNAAHVIARPHGGSTDLAANG